MSRPFAPLELIEAGDTEPLYHSVGERKRCYTKAPYTHPECDAREVFCIDPERLTFERKHVDQMKKECCKTIALSIVKAPSFHMCVFVEHSNAQSFSGSEFVEDLVFVRCRMRPNCDIF